MFPIADQAAGRVLQQMGCHGDAKAPKCRKIAGVGSVGDIKARAFEALK